MALTDYLDPERSTLGSALRFLDRPGQVVRNVLRGDMAAAGRQLVDIVGDVVDAPLPGDWIPTVSKPEDFVYTDQLLDIEDQPWYVRYPIGIAGDILTDPLSWVSFGGSAAATKIARGIKSGADLAEVGAKQITRTAAKEAGDELVKRAANLRRTAPMRQLTGQALDPIESELSGIIGRRREIARQLKRLEKRGSASDDILQLGAGADTTQAMRALKSERRSLGKDIARIRRGFEESVATELAQPQILAAKREALRPLLERNLKNSARRRLAKQPGGVAAKIDDIVGEIGDDVTPDRIEAVLSSARHADAFNQGGLRTLDILGSRRIKAADWAYSKAAGALGKLADAVPERGRALAKQAALQGSRAWEATKKTLGWNFLDANSKALGARYGSLVSRHSNYAATRTAEIFQGVNNATDTIIARAFDDIGQLPDGTYQRLSIGGESVDDVVERLRVLRGTPELNAGVDLDKVDWDQAARVIRELTAENERLWDEWVAKGVLTDVNEIGGRASYLRREFTGRTFDEAGQLVRDFDQFDDIAQRATGNVKSAQGRVIQTTDDLVDYLNAQPELSLEASAFKRAMGRAAQQGVGVAQADLAREILGKVDVVLSDAGVRNKVAQGIAELANRDRDLARLLQQLWGGMGARTPIFKALAGVNRVFKPAAVYGLLLPRWQALVRNQVGGIWQTLSVGGLDLAGKQARSAISNLHGTIGKGLAQTFGKQAKWGGKIGRDLQFFDELTRMAPDAAEILAAKRGGFYADALREGVLDTFVNTEQLLRRTMRSPKLRKLAEKADIPGEMFNYLESSMRWGTYKGLREAGYGSKAAADIVRDAFLDYGVTSSANRTLRDLIPFAAFTSQTIPQQLKFLQRSPAAAVGLASLMRGTDEPVSPWIADQPHLQVGEDAYLTSLGLPVEALNVIPDPSGGPRQLGADIRRNIIGSAHPLVKAAYGYVTGEDPYFTGSPYGSYSRTPAVFQAMGAPEKSEAARVLREVAQTGLLQPIESPIRMASQALDERKTVGQRLLNLLTGARIETSDPDRAMVQILQEQLRTDPEARVFRSYYGGSENTESMIAALRDAKRRLKEKRRKRQEASE